MNVDDSWPTRVDGGGDKPRVVVEVPVKGCAQVVGTRTQTHSLSHYPQAIATTTTTTTTVDCCSSSSRDEGRGYEDERIEVDRPKRASEGSSSGSSKFIDGM